MTLPALEQEVLAGTCAGLLGVLLLWAWTRTRHQRNLQTTSPDVLRGLRLATGHGYRRRQPFAWTAIGDQASSGEADPIQVVNPQTRALLLHIRALETVVEEEHAERERIRKEFAVALDDARSHHGARALTTVMALRPRLAGEPGDVAVARVEAALARLSAPSAFSRPPLVAGATAGAAPRLAEPAARPSNSETGIEAGGEAGIEAGVDHRAPQGAGSTALHPPAVVLPVPAGSARTVTASPRRGRWKRRVL